MISCPDVKVCFVHSFQYALFRMSDLDEVDPSPGSHLLDVLYTNTHRINLTSVVMSYDL